MSRITSRPHDHRGGGGAAARINSCKLFYPGQHIITRNAALTAVVQANNAQKKASGILTTDRVHLNEAGNRLVAQTILKSLGE